MARLDPVSRESSMIHNRVGATHPEDRAVPPIDVSRLWAGGIVAAVVAAGIVIVGLLAARVLHTRVLDEGPGTGFVQVNASWYAFGAAVVSLASTALLHLLLLTTPRPRLLFRSIMSVATAIATVAPFSSAGSLASQVTLASIDLAVGVAVTLLNAGFARDVIHPDDRAAPSEA
jgi:hypothetical protein